MHGYVPVLAEVAANSSPAAATATSIAFCCLASLPADRSPACLPEKLPAGLRGEELAAAREVKYQLSSGLRGLGTANLGELCGGYQVGFAV